MVVRLSATSLERLPRATTIDFLASIIPIQYSTSRLNFSPCDKPSKYNVIAKSIVSVAHLTKGAFVKYENTAVFSGNTLTDDSYV